MANLEALIVGVSGGSGYVYDQECSSSILLLEEGSPLCVIDLGYGVTWTLKSFGFEVPDNLIITHNHSDHAGEIPVVLRVEQTRGRTLSIFAASLVQQRLKQHRLIEHAQLFPPEELANWTENSADAECQLSGKYRLRFVPGTHSTPCFGVILFDRNNHPVFGYTSDSGVNEHLYREVAKADLSIFDARPKSSKWHASFEEVAPYLTKNSFIIGHGLLLRDAVVHANAHLPLLFPGQRLSTEI